MTEFDSIRGKINEALPQTRQQFPRLDSFLQENTTMFQPGAGRFFSETFPRGESFSPNPEVNVIQIRPSSLGFDNSKMTQSLAGEILHLLGGIGRDGKPNDPEFFALKKEFLTNMTDKQKLMADKMFRRNADKGATGENARNKDAFLFNSFIDGEIRGSLFPDLVDDPSGTVPKELIIEEREAFRAGRNLSPKQKVILDKMKKLLTVR